MRSGSHVQLAALRNRDLELQTTSPSSNHGTVERSVLSHGVIGPYIYLQEIIFQSSLIKHQLDPTLCRFYFCRVTLHVSDASAHHQEYLKLVQLPLVRVLSLQVSHHITLLIRRCDELTCNHNTRTSGRCTSFKYS